MNAQRQRETEQAIQEATVAVNAAESASQQIHADMHRLEERLAALQAQQAQAESAYSRAREVIGVNEQRIAEYKAWSDRDGREINATRQQLDEIGMQTESLEQKAALLEEGLETARADKRIGKSLEAHVALMEFENSRIVREVRNTVNRRVNCETANITKTVTAAARQVDDILFLQQKYGFEKLPVSLRQMAEVRLEYPEAPLKEIGRAHV